MVVVVVVVCGANGVSSLLCLAHKYGRLLIWPGLQMRACDGRAVLARWRVVRCRLLYFFLDK